MVSLYKYTIYNIFAGVDGVLSVQLLRAGEQPRGLCEVPGREIGTPLRPVHGHQNTQKDLR